MPGSDILYDRFPVSHVIVTNVLNIFTLLSGSLLLFYVQQWLGILYFVYFLGTIIWALKVRCTNCWYYGKRCAAGYGLIAAKLFKKGAHEKLQQSGLYTLPIIIVPLFLGIYGLFTKTGVEIGTVFFIFLIISLFRIIMPRIAPEKISCRNCNQRKNCRLGLSMTG